MVYRQKSSEIVTRTITKPSRVTSNVKQEIDMTSDSKEQTVTGYQYHYIDQEGRKQPFNQGWRFLMADVACAQDPSFDDSNWQVIHLPHDFSLTQPYTRNGEAESAYKLGGVGWYRHYLVLDEVLAGCHVAITFEGSYMETEIYVNGQFIGKHLNGYQEFTYDISDVVTFGAENLLAVRVENKVPSSRWYSGSGLYREVSLSVLPQLHFVADQVVMTLADTAVQEKGQQKVDLRFALNQSIQTCHYQLSLCLWEQSHCSKDKKLLYQETEVPLADLAFQRQYGLTLSLEELQLWSPDNPHLYDLELTLYYQGQVIDCFCLETGFRQLTFMANQGLFVNGRAVKLKGVCLHHDQGGLGACAYEDALARQLVLLKDMGANTIRSTHNPSSPKLRKLANRLGFFVIEEAFDTWTYAKNGNVNDFSNYFHQTIGTENANYLQRVRSPETSWAQYSIEAMVWSVKNDPSVLMWSIGNELMEGFSADVSHYPELTRQMCQWIAAIDTSRPITFGDNKLKEADFCWHEEVSQMATLLSQLDHPQGLIGLNYANGKDYDRLHEEHSDWLLYGSETVSAITSRAYYKETKKVLDSGYHLTSYDHAKVDWGAFASQAWYDTITRDFVAGECVWTGFDYLGEPTPWNKIDSGVVGLWPSPKNAYFGILDTAGFPKDSYYFYQSQWAQGQTTLHLLPVWQKDQLCFDEQGLVEVVVYSNAASVQLMFEDEQGNLTDYGRKAFHTYSTPTGHTYQLYQGADAAKNPHENLYLTWRVPYQKGLLRAVAYDISGKSIPKTSGRSQVRTYGSVAKLSWKAFEAPIDAPWELLYLDLSLLDSRGELVSHAQDWLKVQVEGPARLLALDNGNPTDHTPYQEPLRQAYGGKLLAILALTGEAGHIKVTAKASQQLSSVFQTQVACRAPKEHLVTLPLEKYQFKKSRLTSQQEIGQSCLKTTQFLSVLENKDTQQKAGKASTPHILITSYQHYLPLPLQVCSQAFDFKKGDDIFLPQWLQVKDVQGSFVKKAFPMTWYLKEKIFAKPILVTGYVSCFGQSIPVEARLNLAQASKRRHQDLSLVAKQSLATSQKRLTYCYQYDTVQAIGAISLQNHTGTSLSVSVAISYGSQSSIKQETLMLADSHLSQLEEVIFFDDILTVLYLAVTLEVIEGPDLTEDSIQIGLWDLA
ncbi:TPA: glycoside hydrolase family 2 protein [Streptococcus pyogenes]|nr:glycoside hydrolase family 2 protein [Streptococcus pyogenes]HEP1275655.1 glycoside hydrolase family 2 protein [Streptococcus pyogenes]HEQ1314692.1 glycoside hydrolase family 2 protein [Streptococcus pyogenes]HEQ9213549.1 glycoside hydrolase family 2 protein [Streptococcus pyogenes]HER7825947.1 glycoside hydrolase family 2 protein [Streptococcus pyogenes]